jgi:hypothetical protein
VPARRVDLVEPEPLLGAVLVEQAELDLVGDFGEEGKFVPAPS